MVKIKSLTDIADKWANETPKRAPYYEKEVAKAGDDFLTGAKAGQTAYVEAMSDPDTLKRREDNLDEAAKNRYVKNATKLGPARFRAGIPVAKEDFSREFGSYHAVISDWVKPERGPRGDPKNYDISREIGEALHKKRVGSS